MSAYNVARRRNGAGSWLTGLIFLALGINAHASQDLFLDGIIGGENAAAGAWPWQISIGQGSPSSYFHFCGGVLVDREWVVTAAHCVVNVATGAVADPGAILIRAGVTDLSDPNAVHAAVAEVIPHEQFERRIMQNDIALLRLTAPIECPACRSIRLVRPSEEPQVAPPGTTAFVTGWGDINPSPGAVTYTTQLMQVDVPIVSNADCAALYQPQSITSAMVCAGWVGVGGKDSCQGDSGGPLVVRNNEGTGYLLEGVVSWGMECADPGFPGVYTRASTYAGWVDGKILPSRRSGGSGTVDPLLAALLMVAYRRRRQA